MKTIVLYTRRNVGVYSLSFLKALGYEVKVYTDDENVKWLSGVLGCELVTLETMGDFDIFLSIHGNKIVPMGYLDGKIAVNIHPCLFKYKGQNPIKRYIENQDVLASVESHYMIEEVDEGGKIAGVFFTTPKVKTYQEFYDIALPKYFQCIHQTLNSI